MGGANSGGPVGEGHGHIDVGEVRVDAAVAPVQAAPQGNVVGPVPVVAAADPAIVALLQELLASQQAVTARLTNAESNQAHPQLQQPPTGAGDTPASADSPPVWRRRPQHGIRDKRRNTAAYGHRRREGKHQAGG